MACRVCMNDLRISGLWSKHDFPVLLCFTKLMFKTVKIISYCISVSLIEYIYIYIIQTWGSTHVLVNMNSKWISNTNKHSAFTSLTTIEQSFRCCILSIYSIPPSFHFVNLHITVCIKQYLSNVSLCELVVL